MVAAGTRRLVERVIRSFLLDENFLQEAGGLLEDQPCLRVVSVRQFIEELIFQGSPVVRCLVIRLVQLALRLPCPATSRAWLS